MEPYQGDLIIISYNAKRYLRDCLESIRKYSGMSSEYRIQVIDNGSTDGSVPFLKTLKGIHCTFNNKNLGYGSACNQGIRNGMGQYIFLLNCDLIVKPGWLAPLVETLAEEENVAVVGPRLVSPDGFLVGAGVVGTNAQPVIRGWGEPDEPYRYWKKSQCLSISGACMGIKRSLLNELGYFDEHYFHYFEETDYCYNARYHGYQVIYNPESVVIHRVGQSCQNTPLLHKYYLDSQAYFHHKWSHFLADNRRIPEEGGENDESLPDTAQHN
jgi:GT2 family glycosyltransferase